MLNELANSQDLVAIREIRDNTIIMKNGGYRQIIMVGGVNFALKSETEQNVIIQMYQDFINSLDFPLQIIIHSRKINIEKYTDALEERKAQEISGLLQNQISEYQEFVRSFIKDYAVMRKIFLVVVPFAPPVMQAAGSVSRIPFFSKKLDEKQLQAQIDEQFREVNVQLIQRVERVMEGLRGIGLDAKVLEREEVVELFYNFYNPESIEKRQMNIPAQT